MGTFGARRVLLASALAIVGCRETRADTRLPGTAPHSAVALAAGDLDGDGQADLVVSHNRQPLPGGEGHALTVMRSNGDGTFATAPIPFSEFQVRRVLLRDFDRDGQLDLAALRRDADGLGPVMIYRGKGGGTFTEAVDQVGLVAPGGLDAGDMDGDGILDLVFSDGDTRTLRLGKGRGDGRFEERVLATDASGWDLELADFNRDGRQDVALVRGQLEIFLNDGASRVRRLESHPVGERPRALAIADLNRDGKLDIASVDAASNTLHTVYGRGDGKFGRGRAYPVGPGPEAVAVGHLNSDAWPDVVVANTGGKTVSVLLGRPDGALSPQALSFDVGEGPAAVALADVSGDDTPEIVTVNQRAGTVSVLSWTTP